MKCLVSNFGLLSRWQSSLSLMDVRDPHVGFLTNAEVLAIVKEQAESKHAALAALQASGQLDEDDIVRMRPDNVRTVQIEVNEHISHSGLTMRRTDMKFMCAGTLDAKVPLRFISSDPGGICSDG